MNRAARRRWHSQKVFISEPGIRYDGTLENLSKICERLALPRVTEHPGARVPRNQMPRGIVET